MAVDDGGDGSRRHLINHLVASPAALLGVVVSTMTASIGRFSTSFQWPFFPAQPQAQ
jgi:hypothetical protein